MIKYCLKFKFVKLIFTYLRHVATVIKHQLLKLIVTDRQTDGPTDLPKKQSMDRPTLLPVELLCYCS